MSSVAPAKKAGRFLLHKPSSRSVGTAFYAFAHPLLHFRMAAFWKPDSGAASVWSSAVLGISCWSFRRCGCHGSENEGLPVAQDEINDPTASDMLVFLAAVSDNVVVSAARFLQDVGQLRYPVKTPLIVIGLGE
jgi:hypothetical protein